MSRASSICLPALIALAATAVTACGTATAPGLQTPSVAATSATSAPSSPSGSSTSSSSSSDTSSSSSSSSSAPQSSAGAVCKTDSTIGPVFPAQVSAKPFGTTGQAQNGYSTPSTLQVSPQKPRQLPAPSDSYELDPGMQYVGVDVRTHLASGTTFFVSNIDFNLFDANKHTCYRTSFTSSISADTLLRTTTLGPTLKDANGTLVFEVPVGTDLNSLTLAFGADVNYTPALAWKG